MFDFSNLFQLRNLGDAKTELLWFTKWVKVVIDY